MITALVILVVGIFPILAYLPHKGMTRDTSIHVTIHRVLGWAALIFIALQCLGGFWLRYDKPVKERCEHCFRIIHWLLGGN
jgi:hypothetical protein